MHGITATLMVIARSSIPVHQCVLVTKTPIRRWVARVWRLDLRHSIIHSWAQINYRRQFGDDTYVANGGLKIDRADVLAATEKTQDKKLG
ncbi:outer membrane esterase [Salmonella sp. NCTC 11881]|nr:outer membrane esterase [Salmonella sp. NCTC 11881]